jgi:hypothetical protein
MKKRRLPSFRGTPVIGGFLTGLEQIVFHRPPPAEVAESHQVTDTLDGADGGRSRDPGAARAA